MREKISGVERTHVRDERMKFHKTLSSVEMQDFASPTYAKPNKFNLDVRYEPSQQRSALMIAEVIDLAFKHLSDVRGPPLGFGGFLTGKKFVDGLGE